jgi:hypothetical protein
MSMIDDLLGKLAADIPGLVTQVNDSLAPAGTSLPALEKAVTAMIHEAVTSPGTTLPKVLVDGAEVAFAADPVVAIGLSIGYALFASGIAQPADQAFFDHLDATKGDGNPYGESS